MKTLFKIAKATPLMGKAELEYTRRKGKKWGAKGDAAAAGGLALLGAGLLAADQGRTTTALGGLNLALAPLHGINAIRQHQATKKYKHLSDSELEKLVKSNHG